MDYRLIERCRAGDSVALERFVKTYQTDVYRLALSILDDSSEAEDVTQESLLAALRALHSFHGDSSLKTWLYSITVNRCRTRLQQFKRRERLTEIFAYPDRIADWWDGTALVQGFDDGIPSLAWLRSDGTTSILKPFEICQAKASFFSTYEKSSNGSLIFGAQCSNGDLWLYWANPDGTAIKQLLDSPISAKPGSLDNISLSSDGYSIAFNIASSDKTEMYILNANDALNNPSVEPKKFVVGAAGFSRYNISWQPKP